ncbi:MAG: hypothetical protein LH606_02940 [Cytophagaceae bacterium]|nr:hypothetical protein [Cytophagaceae bacterium]
MERHCTHCGEPLDEAAPAHRHYCTDACRQAAYRTRIAKNPVPASGSGGTALWVMALGVGLLMLARR